VDAEALKKGTLTPANTPKTPNSLGLDIETNDVGYIATVQMGTPPRDFKLLMDSGSADLWVGSEGCTSETGPDCVSSPFVSFTLSMTIHLSVRRAIMYFSERSPQLRSWTNKSLSM
jgi:hypothetical protein